MTSPSRADRMESHLWADRTNPQSGCKNTSNDRRCRRNTHGPCAHRTPPYVPAEAMQRLRETGSLRVSCLLRKWYDWVQPTAANWESKGLWLIYLYSEEFPVIAAVWYFYSYFSHSWYIMCRFTNLWHYLTETKKKLPSVCGMSLQSKQMHRCVSERHIHQLRVDDREGMSGMWKAYLLHLVGRQKKKESELL